jgi:exosortase
LSTAEAGTAMAMVETESQARRRATVLKVAVLASLLAWLFWPVLVRLERIWSTQANWSHGFIVPLFSLYFLYAHRDLLAAARVRPSFWGIPVLLGSLAIYFYCNFVLPADYPKSIALIGCLAGLTLLLCGWRVLRVAWLPIAYLVFAMPLPDALYVRMTFPLRQMASSVAGVLLSTIPGVETITSGVTIDLIYNHETLPTLNVADACSGMRVLMGLCALGVAIAYLGDRPNWQRITLVIFCVPIALFTNLLRVTSTGVFYILDWKLLTEHAGHTAWGLVMYAVALSLFFLLSWVLDHLVVEEPTSDLESAPT